MQISSVGEQPWPSNEDDEIGFGSLEDQIAQYRLDRELIAEQLPTLAEIVQETGGCPAWLAVAWLCPAVLRRAL